MGQPVIPEYAWDIMQLGGGDNGLQVYYPIIQAGENCGDKYVSIISLATSNEGDLGASLVEYVKGCS